MLRRLARPTKLAASRILHGNSCPKSLVLRTGVVTAGIITGMIVRPVAVAEPMEITALQPIGDVVAVPPEMENDTTVNQLWHMMSSMGTWFWSWVQIGFRCGKLCLTFSPVILTLPITYVIPIEWVRDRWWELTRSCICFAGPTYIKFAQWAAMRHDLFDPRVCVQLSKLQSTTRPHSWRETKAILNRILGEQWEDILQLTEDSMIGSGCVAQVYKGRLRESTGYGTQQKEVAVKVLHPGIRRSMELDLALMVSAAHAGEWVGQLLLPLLAGKGHAAEGEVNTLQAVPLRCISLLESVAEFSGFMLSQLDLTHEAEALERLRRNFSSGHWRERIVIPAPVYMRSPGDHSVRLSPHADVLIETYEGGTPMTQIINQITANEQNEEQYGVDSSAGAYADQKRNKDIAALGLDTLLKMLFEDNFVHADLHAGNIVLREVKSSWGFKHPQLVLLDAGLTVELVPQDRKDFLALFKAVIDNDGHEAARLMMSRQGADSPVLQPDVYEREMAQIINYVHKNGLRLKKINVSDLLREVLRLSYEHNVKLESRFVTVVVAIMLAEGMGSRLDPEVDIIARAAPFIRAAALKRVLGFE